MGYLFGLTLQIARKALFDKHAKDDEDDDEEYVDDLNLDGDAGPFFFFVFRPYHCFKCNALFRCRCMGCRLRVPGVPRERSILFLLPFNKKVTYLI